MIDLERNQLLPNDPEIQNLITSNDSEERISNPFEYVYK